MSGTTAGWSAERRAAQSALMRRLNADPLFVALRSSGQASWTPEQRAARDARLRELNADPKFRAKRQAGIVGRRPRAHRVPEHAHPCVRGLFVEMNEQCATRASVADRAGFSAECLTKWKTAHMPTLDIVDAALGALDFELAIVPRGSRDVNGFYKKPRAAAKGD